MDVMKLDNTYVANTYARTPIVIDHGKGAILYDNNGKKYIDLGSGIAVNVFGAGDGEWVSAVTDQLDKIAHTSNLYYTEPQAKLAQLLCEKSGMRKVFFGNSGAEANECAIKAARKYNSDQYGESIRSTIVTLEQSFHGRTLTTISATGQDSFHKHFHPFTPGFVHTPANDVQAMKLALKDECVGAVMIEMVQGEGGVVSLTHEFVQQTANLCHQKNILLIVDEVQTGNGRTGTLYAYEQFGITPDIVTTAKGIGGGLPIGCCLLGEKLEHTLGAGTHGSTFGGNLACCAGALSILKRIDQDLLDGVKKKYELILRELQGASGVKSVTGLGLMLGIEVEKPANEVLAACREKGLLVLTAKHKIRFLPALTITEEELMEALTIFKEVVKV